MNDKLFHRLQLTVAALCAIVLAVQLQGCESSNDRPNTPTTGDVFLPCNTVTCSPTTDPSPITK